jgi:hypothetical protein
MPAQPHDVDLATLLAGAPKWAAGLRCLLEAHYWAQPRRDRWGYAVPSRTLRKHGLTNQDLQLLLAGGYVRVKPRRTSGKKSGDNSGAKEKLLVSSSTAVRLTPSGVQLARSVYLRFAGNGATNGDGSPGHHLPVDSKIPHWDAERGHFWVGGELVMRLSRRAKNLRALLNARSKRSAGKGTSTILCRENRGWNGRRAFTMPWSRSTGDRSRTCFSSTPTARGRARGGNTAHHQGDMGEVLCCPGLRSWLPINTLLV